MYLYKNEGKPSDWIVSGPLKLRIRKKKTRADWASNYRIEMQEALLDREMCLLSEYVYNKVWLRIKNAPNWNIQMVTTTFDIKYLS